MKKTEKLTQQKLTQENDIVSATGELDIIRNSLLLQKSEILNRNCEFKSAQSKGDKFSDEADQTAQELENNLSIQLHERERHALLLIEKTLSNSPDWRGNPRL